MSYGITWHGHATAITQPCHIHATAMPQHDTAITWQVTRTKNKLQEGNLRVHMRNGSDPVADTLRDAGLDIDGREWMAEWGAMAERAELVVCFADSEYRQSDHCMKELNLCEERKQPSNLLVIDDYKDKTADELATIIQNKIGQIRGHLRH